MCLFLLSLQGSNLLIVGNSKFKIKNQHTEEF